MTAATAMLTHIHKGCVSATAPSTYASTFATGTTNGPSDGSAGLSISARTYAKIHAPNTSKPATNAAA